MCLRGIPSASICPNLKVNSRKNKTKNSTMKKNGQIKCAHGKNGLTCCIPRTVFRQLKSLLSLKRFRKMPKMLKLFFIQCIFQPFAFQCVCVCVLLLKKMFVKPLFGQFASANLFQPTSMSDDRRYHRRHRHNDNKK